MCGAQGNVPDFDDLEKALMKRGFFSYCGKVDVNRTILKNIPAGYDVSGKKSPHLSTGSGR
jgi:hypothetical protein